jgi:hypothetical protein
MNMAGLRTELRAEDLATLLSKEVRTLQDGAAFLGIDEVSLDAAAYRRRIPFVRFGNKKLFTLSDLRDYRDRRGLGHESKLEEARSFTVETMPSRRNERRERATA